MQSIGSVWRLLAMSLVLSVVAVAPSVAGTTDDAVREAVASGRTARIIMQFATAAERDAAFTRLLDRGAAVRSVDTEAGPVLVVFGSAASFAGEISRASQVSLDAGVRVLAAQQPARDTSIVNKSSSNPNQPDSINGSRGGFAVAIIDSGIAPQADLPMSRIRAYKDFVTGGKTPVDPCGHGTHVAGIIAGSGAHSNGAYAGIAPDVDIVAVRVLGDDCSGNASDVIDALECVARNHDLYKIKVVNLSLGHSVLE